MTCLPYPKKINQLPTEREYRIMNPPKRSHNRATTAISKITRGDRRIPFSTCPSGTGVCVSVGSLVGVGLSVEVDAGKSKANSGNGNNVVVGVRVGVGVMVIVGVGATGVKLCLGVEVG